MTIGSDSQSGRWEKVPELLARLYRIVDELELLFPGRKFTPDGHLVGSLGEVLAARMFGLELLPNSSQAHDAETQGDRKKVQIKFTQGNSRVALRAEPDHLLVLRLDPADRGSGIEIVYNGKGQLPWQQAGKSGSNGQRPISLSCLRKMNEDVKDTDRLDLINPIDRL